MPRERVLDAAAPALDEILGLEAEIAEHHVAELERRNRTGEAAPRLLDEALAELRTLTRGMRALRQEIRSRTETLHRLREEGERERGRYRELLRSSPVASLVTDSQGVIQDANTAAESLFDRTREHIIRKRIAAFLPRAEEAGFEARLRDALACPDGRARWETHIGSERELAEPVAVSVSVAHDGSGRVDHLRWFLMSLGDRQRAARNAQAYLREKYAREKADAQAARFRLLGSLDRALATRPSVPAICALDEVVVPAFADRCVVRLAADIAPTAGGPFMRALSSRRAVLLPRLHRQWPDQPQPAGPRESEPAAFAIVAPMVARRRALGVLAFVGLPPRAAYCEDDILLAELIAARMVPELAAPMPPAAHRA